MNLEQEIKLFKKYFCRTRTDTFAIQTPTGYIRQERGLTDDDIGKHLIGEQTLGLYVSSRDSKSNYLILDIDSKEESLIRKIIKFIEDVFGKNHFFLIDSGNKGFHIWLHFEKETDSSKAKALGQIICKLADVNGSVEIFPKTEIIGEDRFGSLIKLPFGINLKSNNRCNLLDIDTLQPKDWNFSLIYIKKLTEAKINSFIEKYRYLIPAPVTTEIKVSDKIYSDVLPCFTKLLGTSIKEHEGRDKSALDIAIYLKSRGKTEEEMTKILNEWDSKNIPPLGTNIIHSKIEQALKNNYSGSCENMSNFCDKENCPLVKKTEGLGSQNLQEYLARTDITSVEWYIKDFLPKRGIIMISAREGIGKTMFTQNMALALTTGETLFLDKFEVIPAETLYIDLDMGDEDFFSRFKTMLKGKEIPKTFHFVSLTALNVCDKVDLARLEHEIKKKKIDVVVLDCLGKIWNGNENDSQECKALFKILRYLEKTYNISIIIIHHHKKNTEWHKETTGQSSAGSYRITADIDIHITLDESINNYIRVISQKSRKGKKFEEFIMQQNSDDFSYEYIKDVGQSVYDESTLETIFSSFHTEEVEIPRLIIKSRELGLCGKNTLRRIIKLSKGFEEVKGEGRTPSKLRRISHV